MENVNRILHLAGVNKFLSEEVSLLNEIDFNNPTHMKTALSSPIECGFEAEVLWPPNMLNEPTQTSFSSLEQVLKALSAVEYDEGVATAQEKIEHAFDFWLTTEKVYDYEDIAVAQLLDTHENDPSYIEDFFLTSQRSFEDFIETYLSQVLTRLENRIKADSSNPNWQTQYNTMKNWNLTEWGLFYIKKHPNTYNQYIEYLEKTLREDNSAFEYALDIAFNKHDINDWVDEVYSGDWVEMVDMVTGIDLGIANNKLTSVVEKIKDWAYANSKFSVSASDSVVNTLNLSKWAVVPDPSILGSGIAAEIVSPKFDNVKDMLSEMQSLFEYFAENEVTTNNSTGLHVTMSLGGKTYPPLNRLKLALLLGDPHVLSQFNRRFNAYTQSQQDNIKNRVRELEEIGTDLDLKNAKFKDLEKLLSVGISYGKYVTANFKPGVTNDYDNPLVEFRAMGGENYYLDMNKINKVVLRYAIVLLAGHDPDAFKNDYIKSLLQQFQKSKLRLSDDDKKIIKTAMGNPMYDVAIETNAYRSMPHIADIVHLELEQAETNKNNLVEIQRSFFDAISKIIEEIVESKDFQNYGTIPKRSVRVVNTIRSMMKKYEITREDVIDRLKQRANLFVQYPADRPKIIQDSIKVFDYLILHNP